LPIFQVVRFPNDVCAGSTRNGTCFTAEECSNKGGSNEGTCASGFGVCCIISLSCGGSSSDNNTYIVQTSTTSAPASPSCVYKICPCSTDICRIRYDFTTLVMATQQTGTPAATDDANDNFAVGDCVTDQFSISSPGAVGSPTICGYNTGQHMILDSAGTECQTINAFIGDTTTTTRQWDIYVTQYTCGQEDTAGPPGCLQYLTATTGLMKNFGYPSSNSATATAATTTHLSNQNYEICIRRASGYCYICYAAWNSIQATASFGVSIAATDNDKAAQDSSCITDYITIPGGITAAIAAKTTPTEGVERFCGRQFSTIVDDDSTTVCSRSYPFRVGVTFDANEICTAQTALACELNLAIASMPGGIIGFAIGYVQNTC